MERNSMKLLIQQSLSAMKAGCRVAADATSEIQNSVRNPRLKEALEQGSKTSQQWMARIDRALGEVGGDQEQQNAIMQANYEVSQKIRHLALDDTTRDLGIIGSGQLALHYWIASFGTLRTYAANAALPQTVREMQACLDEAKRADEQHNQIAAEILSAQAQRAA